MVSNGGPKEKCWKKQRIVLAIFQHFFFGPPLETMKKSCLNKLKFWEASRNYKRSLSWKFQYSILKNGETSHIPASISENPVPLWKSTFCCLALSLFTKYNNFIWKYLFLARNLNIVITHQWTNAKTELRSSAPAVQIYSCDYLLRFPYCLKKWRLST